MTSSDDYYRKECAKIDARDVNAYLEFKLDDRDPSTLILENPWGDASIDLTPAVKDAETVTHLTLEPENNPTALCFEREDGEVDQISGDALSRIISMTKLKDVDQGTAPVDGDVYLYDGAHNKFYAFNLKTALSGISGDITNAINQLRQELVNAVSNINNQISDINTAIAKPEGTPDNARIMYGNINIYSDYTNSNNRNWGVYAHNISNDIANDEYFA